MGVKKIVAFVIVPCIFFFGIFLFISSRINSQPKRDEGVSVFGQNKNEEKENGVYNGNKQDVVDIKDGEQYFTKSIIVNDLNNAIEVANAFYKIENPPTNKQIGWAVIQDKTGSRLSLDNFLAATDMSVSDPVKGLLNRKNIDIFSCHSLNGNKNIGIVLNIGLFPNYKGSLYADLDHYVKNWEKGMLRDLHPVLFPRISFSQELLQQEVSFQNGKYRYANIKLPGDAVGSIQYEIVEDNIIFAGTVECLEKSSQQLFDITN